MLKLLPFNPPNPNESDWDVSTDATNQSSTVIRANLDKPIKLVV